MLTCGTELGFSTSVCGCDIGAVLVAGCSAVVFPAGELGVVLTLVDPLPCPPANTGTSAAGPACVGRTA
ncbi:hypothetical protein ACW9HQ_43080, partial [Nocardia gipuzkoensis]